MFKIVEILSLEELTQFVKANPQVILQFTVRTTTEGEVYPNLSPDDFFYEVKNRLRLDFKAQMEDGRLLKESTTYLMTSSLLSTDYMLQLRFDISKDQIEELNRIDADTRLDPRPDFGTNGLSLHRISMNEEGFEVEQFGGNGVREAFREIGIFLKSAKKYGWFDIHDELYYKVFEDGDNFIYRVKETTDANHLLPKTTLKASCFEVLHGKQTSLPISIVTATRDVNGELVNMTHTPLRRLLFTSRLTENLIKYVIRTPQSLNDATYLVKGSSEMSVTVQAIDVGDLINVADMKSLSRWINLVGQLNWFKETSIATQDGNVYARVTVKGEKVDIVHVSTKMVSLETSLDTLVDVLSNAKNLFDEMPEGKYTLKYRDESEAFEGLTGVELVSPLLSSIYVTYAPLDETGESDE